MKTRTKNHATATAALDLEPLEGRLFLSRLTGNDVSQYQGTMNWTTNYNTGNRFALIRGSRSDTLPDTAASTNVPAAKAAGLVVGVYHRALPLGYNNAGAFRDPIVDADSFIATSGQWMGTGYIRPILDMEDGEPLRDSPVNGYTTASWAIAWINRIKQVKNVTPIIYTGSSYASSHLNSSVAAAAPDIWIANWNETSYGNPVTGTGNPPQGPWGSGSGWDFWQYDSQSDWAPNTGLGSYYGASSLRIDLDVFNGSDINILKQNYVLGCASIPTGPSPANGATGITSMLLDWADSTNATKYDVYLDNMSTPAATNISVNQWTINTTLTSGAHTWKVVAKGTTADDDTWTTSAVWSFTFVAATPPGAFVNVSPANGVILSTRPVVFDWSDSAAATTYDLYLGTSETPTLTDLTTSTASSLANGFSKAYTWHIVAKNAGGTYVGPTWGFTLDVVAPAATLGTQVPATGQTFLDFTVSYSDGLTGIDFTTLDGNDVTVTGPNGYSTAASFVSVDNASNGTPRVATYRIAAPGGFWNDSDNGSYTVTQVAGQVKDVAGNARAAATIGTIAASTLGTAWLSGTTLNVAFDGSTVPLLLSTDSGSVRVTKNGNFTDFAGVTSISILGSSADDRLQINAPLTPPMSFVDSAGNDLIEVLDGSLTFDADIATASKNIGLYVSNTASVIFNSDQHLRSLSVDGVATLAADGNRVLWVTDLAVTGQLNLSDNDLIWDYTAGSPIGAWAGSAYDGLTGLITQARGAGTWTGNGLATNRAAAMGPAPLTNLGIAEASQVLNYGGGATAMFGGEIVDATAVLVKYTYTADANLSGSVNGDDYFLIDSWYNSGSPSYTHGDFDLNGRIDADDYFLIDSIYGHQDTFL